MSALCSDDTSLTCTFCQISYTSTSVGDLITVRSILKVPMSIWIITKNVYMAILVHGTNEQSMPPAILGYPVYPGCNSTF